MREVTDQELTSLGVEVTESKRIPKGGRPDRGWSNSPGIDPHNVTLRDVKKMVLEASDIDDKIMEETGLDSIEILQILVETFI